MPDANAPSHAGTLYELNPEEVRALMGLGEAILIDVRRPEEYEAERIHGALLLPLSDLKPEFLPAHGTTKVIFHCGSGGRSSQAADRLLAHGHKEAWHLAGGIRGWKAAGLPVIKKR